MKIQCVSDLHGFLPEGIDCDLLLIAGDICPLINHEAWYQKEWLEYDFKHWSQRQKFKQCVFIAGNHDFIFEKYKFSRTHFKEWKKGLANLEYLQDDYTWFDHQRFCGETSLLIYGSPWQPEFYNWAFNLPEEELEKKWLKIPEKTDILLVHGPPKGYGCCGLPGAGSPSLTERIKQIQPQLVICGHIHEGYGEYQIGDTTVLNVSSVDNNYNLRNNPIWTIEL